MNLSTICILLPIVAKYREWLNKQKVHVLVYVFVVKGFLVFIHQNWNEK